jgi:hypothetical protein
VIDDGTAASGRCVVTSATRSGARDAPPTSIMTTRGVPVRCAKNSVCPEKRDSRVHQHALLHGRCDERREGACRAGVAAMNECAEHARGVRRIELSGRHRNRDRMVPDLDRALARRDPAGVVVDVTDGEPHPLGART